MYKNSNKYSKKKYFENITNVYARMNKSITDHSYALKTVLYNLLVKH